MAKGKILMVLAVLMVAIIAGLAINYTLITYEVNKDTTSWLNQANAASSPAQKAQFLQEAKEGFIKHNITTGYDTWYFPTANNDMAVQMEKLDDTIKYANEVEKIPKGNEQAFKNSYEIMSGKVSALQDIDSEGAYLVKTGNWAYPIYIILCIIFAIILGVLGMVFWDD